MRKWAFVLSVSLILVVLLQVASAAVLFSPLDLKTQSGHAEVICVGKAEAPDVRQISDSDIVVTFRVDRVHNGDIRAGSVISISYPTERHQSLTGYDLVLLKKQDDN